MRVFHRTSAENVQAILSKGFRDGKGKYLTDRVHRGVWVSADSPLDGEGVSTPDCVVLSGVPAA